MKNRYLSFSSDPKSWTKDQNLVFLGEWCKPYSNRSIWSSLESKTVNYHWKDREKFSKDCSYLDSLYESYLDDLSTFLNDYHKVTKDKEYWRLIVGIWLQDFIFIVFDKYSSLNKAFEEESITNGILNKYDQDTFIPSNLEDFLYKSTQNIWHEYVVYRILQATRLDKLDVSFSEGICVSQEKQEDTNFLKIKLLNLIESFYSKNTYFFYKSYLSTFNEILLNLKLGQFSLYKKRPDYPNASKVEMKSRKDLSLSLTSPQTDFDKTLQRLIIDMMPKSYLEDFSSYQVSMKNTHWPKSPKIIFSSSAFYEEDLFNMWTAEKKEQGSILITGQHGGNLGVSKIHSNFDHQIKISDKVFMWGSGYEKKKLVSIGNFRIKKNQLNYDKSGHLLLIQNTEKNQALKCTSSPFSSLWLSYHLQQQEFFGNLIESIQQEVLVRLQSVDDSWFQKERWIDEFPSVKLDNGLQDINDLYKNSRLVVVTSHGTSHVEAIHMNIPTVIFWDESLWEIESTFNSLFDELKAVGIFHADPLSASNFINKNWNSIEDWWRDKKVQNARLKFMTQLSMPKLNITKRMSEELLRVVK